ncbi:hypothetical protein A2U01_0060858 [Trifolium medium]|uniref:Retrotransposon Copia-like N-terminal domain-containing protein n=1 Tax=Trifolium medium TaxID=97028 RepID=A0A392RVL9_9FABA|nr:hypothetical protein [Trifolium medium]
MYAKSSASSAHGGFFTNNANKGYQNDTLDPYFMHPNENPALVLSSPILNGGNYHSWSRTSGYQIQEQASLYQWLFATSYG